jgi:hypothetical protein
VKIGVKTFQNIQLEFDFSYFKNNCLLVCQLSIVLLDSADKKLHVNWVEWQDLRKFRLYSFGYEEVRSISNPPADVCLGGGFEIGASAAAII